jgi:hypothetical protein
VTELYWYAIDIDASDTLTKAEFGVVCDYLGQKLVCSCSPNNGISMLVCQCLPRILNKNKPQKQNNTLLQEIRVKDGSDAKRARDNQAARHMHTLPRLCRALLLFKVRFSVSRLFDIEKHARELLALVRRKTSFRRDRAAVTANDTASAIATAAAAASDDDDEVTGVVSDVEESDDDDGDDDRDKNNGGGDKGAGKTASDVSTGDMNNADGGGGVGDAGDDTGIRDGGADVGVGGDVMQYDSDYDSEDERAEAKVTIVGYALFRRLLLLAKAERMVNPSQLFVSIVVLANAILVLYRLQYSGRIDIPNNDSSNGGVDGGNVDIGSDSSSRVSDSSEFVPDAGVSDLDTLELLSWVFLAGYVVEIGVKIVAFYGTKLFAKQVNRVSVGLLLFWLVSEVTFVVIDDSIAPARTVAVGGDVRLHVLQYFVIIKRKKRIS